MPRPDHATSQERLYRGRGPIPAPIDANGRFKIRINGARGGEVGTINGRLEGSSATGTGSLTTHFFGVGILNPGGPSSCGVKKLRWRALLGPRLPS